MTYCEKIEKAKVNN